jgi:hypothetical protein
MLTVVFWVMMPRDIEVVTNVLEEFIASFFRIDFCVLGDIRFESCPEH